MNTLLKIMDTAKTGIKEILMCALIVGIIVATAWAAGVFAI